MAVEVEIDVEVLKSEIKKTYASVSQEPEKDFIFPTGRPWAEDLGYPAELSSVPRRRSARSPGLQTRGSIARRRAERVHRNTIRYARQLNVLILRSWDLYSLVARRLAGNDDAEELAKCLVAGGGWLEVTDQLTLRRS